VVLVLDKSGSMFYDGSGFLEPDNRYDHDNDPGTPIVTRWFALHEAVTAILNQYDAEIEFGVKVFPSITGAFNDACTVYSGVDVPCGPTNAATILGFIPAATGDLDGSTPSGQALVETYSYLSPLTTAGEKAVIFMADGETGCGTPGTVPAISTAISNAYNGGADPSIKTYVVGINASTQGQIDELSTFANAGGVPQGAGSICPDADWVVDTSDPNTGTYSAHSAAIGNNASSSVTLSVNLASAGSISGDIRVSSESGFDFFRVLVDGAEVGSWSGNVAWTNGSFPLTAGAHTITFRYTKDGSLTGGSDRAWIDNVVVTGGAAVSDGFETGDFSGANWSQGGPCGGSFYDAQDTQGLFDALDQILGQLVTCNLVLDPPPPDPDNIEVELLGSTLPQLDPASPTFDCATDDGWYYSSTNVVTLCGQACTDFEAMSVPTADITYFCTSG
jgi:hypothetical protein